MATAAAAAFLLAAVSNLLWAQDTPKLAVEVGGNPVQPGEHINVPDTPIADTGDPLEVTISNTGSAPLELDRFQPPGLEGEGSMMFLLDTSELSSTIDPGESTSFSVVFFPYETGKADATLVIATNDPEMPKFTLDLSGTGTPMADP